MKNRKVTTYGWAPGWAMLVGLMSIPSLAGPNLVAVGMFDLPRMRAVGRDSFDGKSVIFEFPGVHDFGRVVIQSSTPRSLVRRDMQVFYNGQSLVINMGESNINDPKVWIEFDLKGEIRPDREYEYEIDGGPDPEIRGGLPAIMPAFWADGKPMGAEVLLKNPPRGGEKIQRRLYSVRGTVKTGSFKQMTGAASIVIKLPDGFSGAFVVQRLMFREIDEDIVAGKTPEMPVPVRYIPIRPAVERQIEDVLVGTKAVFKARQNPDGYWAVGEVGENVALAAAIVAALAESGEATDSGVLLKAMRWMSETPARGAPAAPAQTTSGAAPVPGARTGLRRGSRPRGGERNTIPDDAEVNLTVEQVAARLYCLARYSVGKEFRRTIAADAEFLIDAQYPDGGWSPVSYALQPQSAAAVFPNNEISFYVLQALRESVFAGIPVDRRTWISAAGYWMDAQAIVSGKGGSSADGGFREKLEQYGGAGEATTIGRTAQGMASLIITLEMAYGPGGSSRGCQQYKANRPQLKAIEKARAWLDRFYGDEFKFGGGLEGVTQTPYRDAWWLRTCGAVSGLHQFNGKDFFRDQAGRLLSPQAQRYNPATGLFGNALASTALAAVTLASGDSPTVFERIVLGGPPAALAEYGGDAQHLVRYLMRARKRPLNWRRTTVDRSVREWLEVPILYVNVAGPVDWSAELGRKLRDYCFNGGVVLVNIDDQFADQRSAVMSGLRDAFPEYAPRALPADHPLYSIKKEIDPPPSVTAIGNGVKDFVFVLRDDWSCIFHLYQTDAHPEAFEFVDNLLAYTMDKTPLRGSFEESTYPSGAATLRTMAVAHVEVGGTVPAYPDLLASLDQSMQTNYRVKIEPSTGGAAPLMWVSFTGEGAPSPEQKRRIMDHVRAGGFLVADVITGNEDWAEAAQAALRRLDVGLTLRHMRSGHSIYTGKVPGTRGFDVREAPLRAALTSALIKTGRNEFLTILYNGREVGAFSAYDIASGVGYNLYPGCRGLQPEAARRLAMNVVLYAMHLEHER